MKTFGIYTLANDVVFDQLVALLNSIEANVGCDIPVCVIPFDNRLSRVKQEIDSRPNVTLFEDQSSIDRWEEFARQFANVHPEAQQTQQFHPRWYAGKLHRKFVAFDGIFEQFVFFDADSLAMKPLKDVQEKLQTYDFVFDDWEHTKSQANAALNIPLIAATGIFTQAEIQSKLHCSSFFGSKRGIFNAQELDILLKRITQENEADWVNGQAWWDDAFLFNYMTLRSNRSQFNFTLSPNAQDRCGNCANADPFVVIDNVLFNKEGVKPIHRIHYMGYPSIDFSRLSQGEDIDIPFKDIFLNYRFLKQPEQKPLLLKAPSFQTKANRWFGRVTKKISKIANTKGKFTTSFPV
ncbi:MAG: Npun_R2821/Npun_R2822 family protein, partial [Rivularia sp. (in: cyanobacteria)]